MELNELLSNSKLIIEENTYISDKIRLLKYQNRFTYPGEKYKG